MASMLVILRLLAAHLAALICGVNLLSLAVRSARHWPTALRLGVGYPLGTTAITLMLFILSRLSLRLSTMTVLVSTAGLLLASLVARWKARPAEQPRLAPAEREPVDLRSVVLLCLLGLHLLSISVLALRTLYVTHDALWYWGFLALAFASTGTTEFPPQVPFLYPLHVPLGQSYLYLAMGQPHIVLGKTFFVAQFWALAACIYGLQRVHGVKRPWSLFFTLASTVGPLTMISMANHAMGDLTESTGVLLLFVGTALFFRRQEWDWLRLAGIGATVAVWTKPEGFLWLAIAVALSFALCWKKLGLKRAAGAAATLGLLAVAVAAMVAGFARSHGLPTAGGIFTFEWQKIPSALKVVLSSLVNPWDWGCVWWLWLAAILAGGRSPFRGERGVLNALVISGILATIPLHATTGVNPGVGPHKRFAQLLPAVAVLLGWTWPTLLSLERRGGRSAKARSQPEPP